MIYALTGERSLCSGAHVQWLDRQPHGVNAGNLSSSRASAGSSAAALMGHSTSRATLSRRSSISTVRSSPLAGAIGATATGTNSARTTAGCEPLASLRQPCSMLALMQRQRDPGHRGPGCLALGHDLVLQLAVLAPAFTTLLRPCCPVICVTGQRRYRCGACSQDVFAARLRTAARVG